MEVVEINGAGSELVIPGKDLVIIKTMRNFLIKEIVVPVRSALAAFKIKDPEINRVRIGKHRKRIHVTFDINPVLIPEIMKSGTIAFNNPETGKVDDRVKLSVYFPVKMEYEFVVDNKEAVI
jgi:hypothetical protein